TTALGAAAPIAWAPAFAPSQENWLKLWSSSVPTSVTTPILRLLVGPPLAFPLPPPLFPWHAARSTMASEARVAPRAYRCFRMNSPSPSVCERNPRSRWLRDQQLHGDTGGVRRAPRFDGRASVRARDRHLNIGDHRLSPSPPPRGSPRPGSRFPGHDRGAACRGPAGHARRGAREP